MSKKGRPTNEELLAQFDTIEGTDATPAAKPSSTSKPSEADDVLKEFDIPERPKSSGRHSPKPASASKNSKPGTPTPDGSRSSEDKVQIRKSGESARSFHNSFTPASVEEAIAESGQTAAKAAETAKAAGGSWWSTLTSTASAAVKQAEALAKEIQQNEEAQRWAEQVKGNVTQLRGIGMVDGIVETGGQADIGYRWRASFASDAHIYRYPTHAGAADILARAATDTSHT